MDITSLLSAQNRRIAAEGRRSVAHGAFRSRAFYTRRKFRPIYAKVMNKTPHIHRNSSSFVRYYGNAMSLLAEALPSNKGLCLFDYPFNELVVRELSGLPRLSG